MRIVALVVLLLLTAAVCCGIYYVPRHDGNVSMLIGMVLTPTFGICWAISKLIPQPQHVADPSPRPGSQDHGGEAPVAMPWVVAMTVTLATFMEVLDTTIANVSLPYIAGDLGVSVDEASWVLTTYLVANAIVLPLSGWISGLIGRKNFYMSCVFLFTLSSALCGMAPSLAVLLLCRVFQGAGGGGLQPSEQGILLDTFPGAKRGMAMSIYGIAVLVAPILGPTLGGYITENFNWRWIFYINVPIGCLSLFLTSLVVHDPPYLIAERQSQRGKPFHVDYAGLGLIAVGLAALEIIYDRGQEDDWFNSHFILVLIVLAIVCLAAAVMWELRHPNPIVNVRLLGERNFAASCVVIFVVFAVLYGSNVLLPQFLQALLTYDAYTAGLILSPGGIAVMVCMPLSGWLLSRGADARYLIFFGVLSVAAASYWSSLLNLDASPYIFVIRRCAQLFGMAFIFAPINTAAYTYLSKEQASNATGLYNLIRNEGSSLGIAMVNTLLARRGQFHQSRLTENLDPFNPILTSTRDTLSSAYHTLGGYDTVSSGVMALQQIYNETVGQALSLSYFDIYHVFGIAAFFAAPLVFLMRRSVKEKGAAAPVH
jgi:DHA2 family multidrug resistance protein